MDDYLTLRSSEADERFDNGVISWYIPSNYYTSARGTVCDVNLTLYNVCCLPADLPGNEFFTVETSLPIYNNHDTKNDGWNVMGIITNQNGTARIGEMPVYRTAARPGKISVMVRRGTDVGLDWTDTTNNSGVFVFKFSYEDPDEAVDEYQAGLYKTR